MGMFSFNQNAGETPESIARHRKIADALAMQAMDASPIQHWTQGMARVAAGLGAGMRERKANKAESEGRKTASDGFSKIMASLYPGQAPSQPAANVAQPSPAPMAPGGDTFKKMIQVESGGNPNAVSPKGATGIAQVMPATARDPGFGLPNIFDFAKKQGVQVADNSDATLQALLRNPQVNAGFGEAYFNAQKARYGGDEKLAAAAYNAGPGAVDKAGGVPNIPETQAYVQKLGLNGGQSAPQIQPASSNVVQSAPQPAQMQDAAQQVSQLPMEQLMELAGNPYLNETQQQIINMVLKQKLSPDDSGANDVVAVGGRLVNRKTGKVVYNPPQDLNDQNEFGLQPFVTRDANGNLVAYQLSKSGEIKKIDIPAGQSVAPQLQYLDTGLGFNPVDKRGGAVPDGVGAVPKNVQGEAAATAVGKEQGAAQAQLPAAKITADQTISKIDELLADPNLGGISGIESWLPDAGVAAVSGSGALGLRRRVEQLKGSAFLEAYNGLRGGGQITENEGKRAEDALARLDTAQSDSDYVQALKDFRDAVQQGYAKLQARAGAGPQPQAAPAQGQKRMKFNPATGELE